VSQRIALQTEYVARRLAGRPARNAGDPMLGAQTRSFGLVYEDSPGQTGLRSAETLERDLRRAGVELLDSVGFSLAGAGAAARLAPGQDEAWRIHMWHTGGPPPARATHSLIYRAPWIFFTGLHLGGPLVTPATIHDGLFRLPPAGRGMVTSASVSFGRHGVWAGEDYGAAADWTELWWDATTAGPAQ